MRMARAEVETADSRARVGRAWVGRLRPCVGVPFATVREERSSFELLAVIGGVEADSAQPDGPVA